MVTVVIMAAMLDHLVNGYMVIMAAMLDHLENGYHGGYGSHDNGNHGDCNAYILLYLLFCVF